MVIFELGKAKNIVGKAGNLNGIFKGFNIPRGFVLPNDNFKEFLSFNNISLTESREFIIEKIIDGILPFETELLDYFTSNKYEKVIVRSSASVEDNHSFSLAGQFESYSNTEITSLIYNIKKCWISQFQDNIIEYLNETKIAGTYTFDILIQEMIDSDISGVAFSVNPSNGIKEIVVEIANAPCEKVVSGKIIPRVYAIRNDIEGDNFLSKEMLLAIKENIQRLKKIFNFDVEIEFGFKNMKFYLFQVRPITSVCFSLKDYIKTEFWCSFKNNNWTLFNRSLWILGANKYKNKRINNLVTEDITLYYPHNLKQIRGFNGSQPPLDEETIKSHNSQDINIYIVESYQVVERIKTLSKIINDNIDNNDFINFRLNLKKIIKDNALINSYEYLIGSLGNSLHYFLDKDTIKNLEKWRNSQDNSYFPIYDKIFNYIYKYFSFDIPLNLLWMYLHVNELIKLCDGKLGAITIVKRIKEREKNGFVLLNIHEKNYWNKVVINKEVIKIVNERFKQLHDDILEEKSLSKIKGKSTFKNKKIIVGECVVIKNNNTKISALNLNNKILVCGVTTAKDVKYLKNAKALIVDNGGILCHSAIFSREFKIPCLMGCEIATDCFKSGDIISYNVDLEYAEKLSL